MDQVIDHSLQESIVLEFLSTFNKHDVKSKKCVYVHGPTGCGKTGFVLSVLKTAEYDVIKYDTRDARNKSIVDGVNVSNMSDQNVLNMFYKKKSKIAILMDEVDSMNNGDKGGINTLIKLIRPKKTKRQRAEDRGTHVPIICIGNNTRDKKITELMKCCVVIELFSPTPEQILTLVSTVVPKYAKDVLHIKDLHKITQLVHLDKHNYQGSHRSIFYYNNVHEDSKQITQRLLTNPMLFSDHININDTDRTIIGLLWHENIIDTLKQLPIKEAIRLYILLLDEICYADFIDRITFQKQIWIFNEMSFLIKTFYTNYMFQRATSVRFAEKEVRFTKVLTKYSTEYNNNGFIQKFCFELGLDKCDMFTYMQSIMSLPDDEIIKKVSHTTLTLLDIQRLYRYMQV